MAKRKKTEPKTWQEREKRRLADGTYQRLPYAWRRLTAMPDHFAHLSKTTPGLIAYTSDARNGARDIQTPLKPGKYLQAYYPDLRPDRVTRLIALVRAEADTVHFARTPDEIVRVYEHGPYSCMAGSEGKSEILGLRQREPSTGRYVWPAGQHPVRAYGDGDLQVAYLLGEGPNNNNIIARAVVWPEKKVYSRIYGDQPRLRAKLKSLKYRAGRGYFFDGARLSIIRTSGDHILWPHIDNHRNFGHEPIDDKHTRLVRDGSQQAGYLQQLLPCERPGCRLLSPKDRLRLVYGTEQRWCSKCITAQSRSGAIEPLNVYDGNAAWALKDKIARPLLRYYPAPYPARPAPYRVTNEWLNRECFYCAATKTWYYRQYFRSITMPNGELWEARYHAKHHAKKAPQTERPNVA